MNSKHFFVRWLVDYWLQRKCGEPLWVALRDSYHNAGLPTLEEWRKVLMQ
jgi:hypothetical protein